jgi:DNA polymerase elongation subunit (family B)
LFLEDYLQKCYDIYSKNCGTENYQSFELEKISDAGVWLAKKKYVYNTVWKDPGIDVESLTDITAKGVEIVQSSSSKFVRDTLKNLLKHIFMKKKDFNVAEFAGILKKIKEEYRLKNLEDIAASSSIGDYEKHVLMDKEKLVLEKGCPIHVRAAAIYNNKLFNSKYKKKYQPIRSGEKVKYYFVKTNNPDENVFAFISGSFPVEFAPPIDYDVQFSKNIVGPINRFVEAMGYSPVSPQLVVSTQLF